MSLNPAAAALGRGYDLDDDAEVALLSDKRTALDIARADAKVNWRDRLSARIYSTFFVLQLKSSHVVIPAWAAVALIIIELAQLLSIAFSPVFHWHKSISGVVFDITGVLSFLSLHIYSSSIVYWVSVALVLIIFLGFLLYTTLGTPGHAPRLYLATRGYATLIAYLMFIPLLVAALSALLCEVGLPSQYVYQGPQSGYCWNFSGATLNYTPHGTSLSPDATLSAAAATTTVSDVSFSERASLLAAVVGSVASETKNRNGAYTVRRLTTTSSLPASVYATSHISYTSGAAADNTVKGTLLSALQSLRAVVLPQPLSFSAPALNEPAPSELLVMTGLSIPLTVVLVAAAAVQSSMYFDDSPLTRAGRYVAQAQVC